MADKESYGWHDLSGMYRVAPSKNYHGSRAGMRIWCSRCGRLAEKKLRVRGLCPTCQKRLRPSFTDFILACAEQSETGF